MIKKVAWSLFFALLAMSCLDDPDCYNLSLNVIGISFKKIADGKNDTLLVTGISMEGTDSIFYSGNAENPVTGVTGVTLPLNYLTNETAITFSQLGYTGPFTNSLNLSYYAKAQFVSEDCGERYVLSDLNVVTSDFDSTRLVSTQPTKNPSTNIIIYRCPVNDRVKFSFRQWQTDTDPLGVALTTDVNSVSDDFSGITYTAQDVSSVALPINHADIATKFNFDVAGYGASALTLNYGKVTRALYNVCGLQDFFTDITLSDVASSFDKVEVMNDSITDPPITNIAFFNCPETNIVRMVFRSTATSSTNIPTDVLKIKADYTTQEFYVGANDVTAFELPLNTASDATTFTFTFESGEKTMVVRYSRTAHTYHDVCPRTDISALQVPATTTTFTAVNILEPLVKFPTVNNIAIINN